MLPHLARISQDWSHITLIQIVKYKIASRICNKEVKQKIKISKLGYIGLIFRENNRSKTSLYLPPSHGKYRQNFDPEIAPELVPCLLYTLERYNLVANRFCLLLFLWDQNLP